MLDFIEGTLVGSGLLHVIIQVNGFGYRINAPLTTIEKMPSIGSIVKLYLSEQIRENLHDLYGFFAKNEREFFETLVNKVSGIGHKTALTIMSRLSLNTLKTAINTRDTAILSKCHGIGKKTAERIIIELADKIDTTPIIHDSKNTNLVCSDVSQDAISALISLGFKPTEADKSIKQALSKLGEDASAEELIKCALHS